MASGHSHDHLFVHLDKDLRQYAQSILNRYPKLRTDVQGTELVNMAYARLVARENISAEDRSEFMRVIGRKIHDLIVEMIRHKHSARAGGKHEHEPLVDAVAPTRLTPIASTELTRAMADLQAQDPGCAELVRASVILNRPLREIAELHGLTLHRVRSEIKYGLSFIRSRAQGPNRAAAEEILGDTAHRAARPSESGSSPTDR